MTFPFRPRSCACALTLSFASLLFVSVLFAQSSLPPAPLAQDQSQATPQPPASQPATPAKTQATPQAPAPQATTPSPAGTGSPRSGSPGAAQIAPSGKLAPASPAATRDVPAPNAQAPAGENQTPAEGSASFTVRREVNEVNLIFTVTDHHGKFINNLQQNDFALLDDQRAPAQVFSFSQQTNLPLRVGLLIDASTSIRSRFHFEQQAATEFLLDVLRPRTDRAFVMGFDVTPYVTQAFTNNPDLLEAGVNKLKPGGGTALYDAVYTACRDQMLTVTPSQASLRKALILVSDGDDNQSRAYLDDAIKMCQRAETIVYAISTNTSPSRDRGDDTLKKMAEATGGTAFYPKRIEDISVQFHAVEEELRSQYSLAYKPAEFMANGAYRPIYLTALRGGYVVHALKGYFAPKY